MAARKIGIIMNGVTGRMGTSQHLIRSVLAIRAQGGVKLPGGEMVVPDPILVGRNEAKLRAIASANGVDRYSTDLNRTLDNKDDIVYFDAQPASSGVNMRRIHKTTIACVMLLGGALFAQRPDPFPGKKKLLAIGDTRTGFQHDSVSHALATIERLGYESGAYVTYIRTDSQLLTKGKIERHDSRTPDLGAEINAKNLDYFDAIFYMGTGEGDLSAQQKKDLLAFIHDDGKGFVGAHTADDAFFAWSEFGEMIGGYFDNHPWGVSDAPIVVEDPEFPAMKGFPRAFTMRDEMYIHKTPYSADKIHVLARMDAAKLDLAKGRQAGLHRTDNDFPVAWTKGYGKGRVFYSTFGHLPESWDNPAIQKMYFEAIKWAMGGK